jgi:hypothetical protein
MKLKLLILFAAAFYFFQNGYAQPANESGVALVTMKKYKEGVSITPNPSTGKFLVQFEAAVSGKGGITVTDINGNGIVAIEFVAAVGKNAIPVNLTSYGAGTYKVSVSGPDVSGSAHVVVQRPTK